MPSHILGSAAALATLLAGVPHAIGQDAAHTAETPRLRAPRLLDEAERWLGKLVDVEILEPLEGPTTLDALARLEYGQVGVRIPEGHTHSLTLVPAEFSLADPKRYRRRFDRVLVPPLLVRAELLEDLELRHGARRSFVLRVRSIETLPQEAPVRIHDVAELLADPQRFDRRVIEIEGTHVTGFERSALESRIWLEHTPDARIVGTPPEGWGTRRVRVVGTLFAQPNGHYGHLGAYPLLLRAREIEFRRQ